MGIDFMVDYDCELKSRMGPDEIVARIKGRNQANAVIEKMKAEGKEANPEEVTFRRVVMSPEGPREEDCSVARLLEEGREIEKHAHKCAGCPANFRGKACGCYGYVAYPIPKVAERWLLSRLPHDLDTMAGSLLKSAIADFGYDGEPVDRMRREGDTFFESPKPVARKWGTFLKGTKITSSQLLQGMFMVGSVEPTHSVLQCYFLGVIPHDTTPEQFAPACSGDGDAVEKIMGPEPKDGAPEAAAGMVEFVAALRTGALLGACVSVDG